MSKHCSRGHSSSVGVCGMAGERCNPGLQACWAPTYSGVQSLPGSSGCHSNLVIKGPRGGLGQGQSRGSPPPLPRVLRNLHQPLPVEGFRQLAFPSRGPASAPCTPAPEVCGPCGTLPPLSSPPSAVITLWLQLRLGGWCP